MTTRSEITAVRPASPGTRTADARRLLWHGAVMTTLGLLSGFTPMFAAVPELARGAHTVGILQGAVLFGLSGAWHLLESSPRVLKAIRYTLLVGFYANWVGMQLAAFWSAGRSFFPNYATAMAAGAPPWQDAVVGALLIVSVVTVVSALLVVVAARGQKHA